MEKRQAQNMFEKWAAVVGPKHGLDYAIKSANANKNEWESVSHVWPGNGAKNTACFWSRVIQELKGIKV